MSDDYLPTTQAALLLRCSGRRLRQLAAEGKVRALRRGERGRLFFRKADVLRLLRPAAQPAEVQR